MLVGSAAGITCRACGKTFETWAALMAEKSPATAQEAPDTGNETPAPENVTAAQEAPDTGKRGKPKKTVQE
jgi:hypothetical protein